MNATDSSRAASQEMNSAADGAWSEALSGSDALVNTVEDREAPYWNDAAASQRERERENKRREHEMELEEREREKERVRMLEEAIREGERAEEDEGWSEGQAGLVREADVRNFHGEDGEESEEEKLPEPGSFLPGLRSESFDYSPWPGVEAYRDDEDKNVEEEEFLPTPRQYFGAKNTHASWERGDEATGVGYTNQGEQSTSHSYTQKCTLHSKTSTSSSCLEFVRTSNARASVCVCASSILYCFLKLLHALPAVANLLEYVVQCLQCLFKSVWTR